MHHGGCGLGTRLRNTCTCASKPSKYRSLAEPLSAACVNTGCTLNTDYKSQVITSFAPHPPETGNKLCVPVYLGQTYM